MMSFKDLLTYTWVVLAFIALLPIIIFAALIYFPTKLINND